MSVDNPSPEDTLRACQRIIGRYFEHEIEEKEAFELIVEELEKAGYPSVVGVDEVANDG
jgi:hypothetical protein